MNSTIIYGSMGGVTEEVSERLGKIMDAKVVNIADVKEETFSDSELFILATSTWGSGDLTDDWDLGLKKLKQFGLDGKYVAFLGLGDQYGYDYSFCDGMNLLYEQVKERDIKHIGLWPTEGYEFEESTAIKDGKFIGLAIDEDNQDKLTETRLKTWFEQLKGEMA